MWRMSNAPNAKPALCDAQSGLVEPLLMAGVLASLVVQVVEVAEAILKQA